jgi:hypothetical protein
VLKGGEGMPDVSKTEVGRRLFHIQREKGVENAMKKIKEGVGPGWKNFTPNTIRLFSHLLQCTWNVIGRDTWDKIPFGKMTEKDVTRILSYGKGVGPGNNPDPASVQEIKNILLALN